MQEKVKAKVKAAVMPIRPRDPAVDYERIERAIAFIRREAGARRRPSLAEIAAAVHSSEFHLQRLFTRWAGVSPKRFLQLLTLDHAKAALESADILRASLDAGLSSAGRLHDLFVTLEAVTPGEFKRGGAGIDIHWGFHPTPFGVCLIGVTQRGVCFLEFQAGASRAAMLERLGAAWPHARLITSQSKTAPIVRRAFSRTNGAGEPLAVLVRGTNFRTRVWRALLSIPPGCVSSYGRIAASIGAPKASRAVGAAVGANPVAWLIPCHRVLRGEGRLGGYHWGEDRKAACLIWEAAAYPGISRSI